MWYTILVDKSKNSQTEDINMKKNNDILKAIFVIIGVVVSVGALAAVVYTVFKKYFQVTFECDGDCCDCDDCFEDEDVEFEPICCCEEDDAVCECECEEAAE